MKALDFITIMLTYYHDSISLQTNLFISDNKSDKITLTARHASPELSFTINAVDEVLEKKDVEAVIAWLLTHSRDIDNNPKTDGVFALETAITPWDWDDTSTDSLPDEYTVIEEESGGHTIFNGGENIGTLGNDATRDDKTSLILTALATDISQSWGSENSADLVLSDDAMKTVTDMVNSDIAAVRPAVNAQAGTGQMVDDPTDDLMESHLLTFSAEVGFKLVENGSMRNTIFGIRASEIDAICNQHEFKFTYIDDGKGRTRGYLIRDNTGKPIASGKLRKLITDYYLKAPKQLQVQLQDAKFVEAQFDGMKRQEASIKDFSAKGKTGPEPPPDPDHKGGDPNGPGGAGI